MQKEQISKKTCDLEWRMHWKKNIEGKIRQADQLKQQRIHSQFCYFT